MSPGTGRLRRGARHRHAAGRPDRGQGAGRGARRGSRPADRPACIGSVKTNIGHLEAAAGIAGLIKVALALRHRADPAEPALRASPNPHIPFDELALRVRRHARGRGRRPTAPALAGVSSFGFGGTNAHLVLGEAPPEAPEEAAPEQAPATGSQAC